ncbi:MAG: molybdopterin-dependent oxidoreductase [Syntrophobacteraceae bacterium]
MPDITDPVEPATVKPVITRRGFLGGMIAVAALGAVPGGLLRADPDTPRSVFGQGYAVKRSVCPRNCYDTCSMLTYVRDGRVEFVEGDPANTFTAGGLCVKGNSYVRSAYSPDRIKYPMEQQGRGSGNWKRISWDEAVTKIAGKIIESREKDGSLLGVCLNRLSGHQGAVPTVVDGMFASMGYITRLVGTPCWPAGIDAQSYDMGVMAANDPEDMIHSRYIILWGANPAHCSIHSLKYIYAARQRGAKIVCIDPLYTQTAAKADVYWRIKTGTDGALALGMCRHILDAGLADEAWLAGNSEGYAEFVEYLKAKITVEWAAEETGIPAEQITAVAEEFAVARPATVWPGYGLQRHTNGGAIIRSIDALAAMTGNIGKQGGGSRYGSLLNYKFSGFHGSFQPPAGAKGVSKTAPDGKIRQSRRELNINKMASELLKADDPPVRLLWVSGCNPVSQLFDRRKMVKALGKMEMVVVMDLFFNQTVELADIVLPVTTLFEEWNANVGYWHRWLAINEKAIEPLHEAKCPTDIAGLLTARLNQLSPGFSTFPAKADPREFVMKEYGQSLSNHFGISSMEDLLKGPVKARYPDAVWSDGKFTTPSGKYEFRSELCAKHGLNALPVHVPSRKPTGVLRLLTPHSKFGLHSQFINLDWMEDFNPKPFVYMHPSTARQRGIKDGNMVRVHSTVGETRLQAKLTMDVPVDHLVMYEAWFRGNQYNCQELVDEESSDMGAWKTGAPGVALHDQFADVAKI